MIHLRKLTINDADACFKIVDEKEMKEEFGFLNGSKDEIVERLVYQNSNLSMKFGVFKEDTLVGFIICYRKMDSTKRAEFEESDDEWVQMFDEDYVKRIDDKQLAVSPYFINIGIGKSFRSKGYSKLAILKLIEELQSLGIREFYMVIGNYNLHSLKMANSIGGVMIAEMEFLTQFRVNL